MDEISAYFLPLNEHSTKFFNAISESDKNAENTSPGRWLYILNILGDKEFSNIPILMLTAIHTTTPINSEPDIDSLKVDLYVDKPIDPDDLISKVNWLLSREKIL